MIDEVGRELGDQPFLLKMGIWNTPELKFFGEFKLIMNSWEVRVDFHFVEEIGVMSTSIGP